MALLSSMHWPTSSHLSGLGRASVSPFELPGSAPFAGWTGEGLRDRHPLSRERSAELQVGVIHVAAPGNNQAEIFSGTADAVRAPGITPSPRLASLRVVEDNFNPGGGDV